MIDWAKPVCTKHDVPLIGDVGGFANNGRRHVTLPSMSVAEHLRHKSPTTWHYDDAGNCHLLGEPNEHDLVNFDPSDGIKRLRLDFSR